MSGTPRRRGRKPNEYFLKGKMVRDSNASNRIVHARIAELENRYENQIDNLRNRLEAWKKTIHLLNQRGASVVSPLRRESEMEIERIEELIASVEEKRQALSRKKANARKH